MTRVLETPFPNRFQMHIVVGFPNRFQTFHDARFGNPVSKPFPNTHNDGVSKPFPKGFQTVFNCTQWYGFQTVSNGFPNRFQIEPAGPEPPSAHSLGRVGEDAMGRSGQLVLVFFLRYAINFVPFFLIFLFFFFVKIGPKNQKKSKNPYFWEETEKGRKNVLKVWKYAPPWGSFWDPKLTKNAKNYIKKQTKNNTPQTTSNTPQSWVVYLALLGL